ncbi:MAG: carbonic anhydrase [Pseudonocardia sediminis]
MGGIERRAVLRGMAGIGLGGVAAMATAGCSTPASGSPGAAASAATVPAAAPSAAPAAPPSAEQALALLQEGNRRWREVHPDHPHEGVEVRTRLVSAQHPIATVLSCVDSRVPPELVFDQGLGDLLTVRTAGQVLDDAVLGSVAFGLLELKIPLVVVLGHESCGAVSAALDATAKGEAAPGHLSALVEAIAPSIPAQGDRTARIAGGVDANVRRVVADLKADADLAGAVARGELTVVGARYDLHTAEVVLL